MAKMTVEFYSLSLSRKVSVQAIIPAEFNDCGGFKTLYLLNGIYGSSSDWSDCSNIEYLAKKYGIAVIMPSGENKFYVDNEKSGDMFGKFIGEELPAVCEKIFNLAADSESRFIGGLSMGGYGAIRNGLKYHKTFSKIAVMSPGLIIKDALASKPTKHFSISGRDFFESVFGDLSTLSGSDMDYYALINSLKNAGCKIPKMLICCGRQDFLYPETKRFHEYLLQQNVMHQFEETDGSHDWEYWRKTIEKLFIFIAK